MRFLADILLSMPPITEQERIEKTGLKSRRLADPSLMAALVVAVGFLLRLRLASKTFLNGDEALHFMAANQPSWKLTYQASLTISHPPLLIFVLHLWRVFGTSETVLRLPSVLAGAVFCWIFFKWVSNLFGRETGVIGVIFASFLPPTIALSAEVRQYAFLLFFAICTMYSLERAIAENSPSKMLLASFCLWLAILSHYSAVLLAAILGAYSLLRMFKQRPPRAVIAVWVAGQIGALLLCSLLYLTYISAFGQKALHSWMDVYLHSSYFDPTRQHALLFAVFRTISVFQYVLGQTGIGTFIFLVFVAGIVFVFRATSAFGSIPVSKGQLATLLLSPFAINCGAALFDVYPYGGTRHCVFLAIFAIAGISFGLYKLAGQRLWRGFAAAMVIVLLCNVFSSHRFPYIAPADQSRVHMDQAIAFIRERIPPSDLLFVDNQTGILLGHYLCRQQPFFINVWTVGFKTLHCGGYRVAATDGKVFVFRATNFFPSWNAMVRTYDLKSGDSVWVLQEGWRWENCLARQLQLQYPEFRDLKEYSFGHNITIFQLKVGQPMPMAAQPLSYTTPVESK